MSDISEEDYDSEEETKSVCESCYSSYWEFRCNYCKYVKVCYSCYYTCDNCFVGCCKFCSKYINEDSENEDDKKLCLSCYEKLDKS